MKSYIQEREVCVLLPNREQLNLMVEVKARGQEVFSQLLDLLGVAELHLFGLSVLCDHEYLFLDLEQKLAKYFGKKWKRKSFNGPAFLYLRVQYYVENECLIPRDSKVLNLYYADLRQKMLQSQCYNQEAVFFQLAAHALQVEMGDQEHMDMIEEGGQKDEEKGGKERHRQYFLPEDYFPKWIINRRGRHYLCLHTREMHSDLRGVPSNQAVLHFITEASALQDAPITFYRLKQHKKESNVSVLLGLALQGVSVYQEVEGRRTLQYNFSWTDIDRFTFLGRRCKILAVGSLCLLKLTYYSPSALHSKHIMKHLSNSHRLHMNTRTVLNGLHQQETATECYQEAYIYDRAGLNRKLCITSAEDSLASSSVSDNTISVATTTAQMWRWSNQEEDELLMGLEMSVDEPEGVSVDNPGELLWLAELTEGVSVDEPFILPVSPWTDVTKEIKPVLELRAHEGVCGPEEEPVKEASSMLLALDVAL